MIFPRVKKYSEKGGYLYINKTINIHFVDETANSLIKAAKLLIHCNFNITSYETADIILKTNPKLSDKNAFYKIECFDKNVIAVKLCL